MKKKLLYKIISLWVAFVIGFFPVFSFTTYSYAEDSPEEIAREAEEAARELARRQQRAEEEAKRQAEEEAREAIEDATPTPIPPTSTLQPQTSPVEVTVDNSLDGNGATAVNDNTGNGSTNDAQSSSSSDVSVDNNNSGGLNNNVTTTANSGNNIISGDSPPSVTPTPQPYNQQNPLPQCEDNLIKEASTGGETDSFSAESSDLSSSSADSSSQNTQPTESSGSSAEANITDNDTVTVTNTNCVALTNEQDIIASSGDNESSNNEGTIVQTGSTIADSSLVNEGNKNVVLGDSSSTGASEVAGEGSSTDSTTENHDQVTVENDNKIYSENNVNVESSSGGNTLQNNDGQAQLTTGDVDMIVTLLNILNVNITGEDFTHLIVNIFGDLNGEVDLDKIAKSLGMNEEEIQAIARNEETEAQSNNDVKNSQSLDADVNNNNDAEFRNNVNVSGESGNNNLSGNEDRTNLVTGRIKILVALINFINTNYTGTDWYFAMVNIFGNLTGDIILPDPNGFLIDDTKAQNTNTGEGSSNNAQSTSEENIIVSNTNKIALTNNVEVTGDSGSNVAYENEDRVKQESGDVNVVTNLTNWLNVNIIGNNWVLLVINVFGKWYGKIIGFPGQGDINAPDSGMLMVAAGGASGAGPAVAENSNTGDGSTNDAVFENSENTNVNNNNQAVGENNIKVEGVSGGNTTNQNEDPVTVTTGWIDISADLLNIVNMNVTGKHWMLVLVNIFGDFLGDITFPGVKKPPLAEFAAQGLTTVESQANESVEQLGGIAEESSGSVNTENLVSITITPTPKTKIEVLAQANNDQESQGEKPKIEIFKASANSQPINNQLVNEEENNEVRILGISVKANSGTQQTLFLIALLAYLIALRFWAFRKNI